jgi:hypothetical protein
VVLPLAALWNVLMGVVSSTGFREFTEHFSYGEASTLLHDNLGVHL